MNEYISGGYYVVKTVPRPEAISGPLPDTLLTVSECLTEVIQGIARLQWDSYDDVREAITKEAAEFGIPPQRIPELVSWAKSQHNTNYHVFADVGVPRDLHTRFISDPSVRVIGIGLHTNLLGSFQSQLANDINKGLGLAELVDEKRPLADGGNFAGFEPLGFYACSFHSWLCHNTPVEASEKFGIQANASGLITNLEDAQRVSEYLLETGAEPGIWEPWLLLEYPRIAA